MSSFWLSLDFFYAMEAGWAEMLEAEAFSWLLSATINSTTQDTCGNSTKLYVWSMKMMCPWLFIILWRRTITFTVSIMYKIMYSALQVLVNFYSILWKMLLCMEAFTSSNSPVGRILFILNFSDCNMFTGGFILTIAINTVRRGVSIQMLFDFIN